MNTKYLGIKAGKTARKKLLKNGLRLEDVEILAAPASGPKWLILFELDKYIMSQFSEKAEKKRHFIGSSAGAWRAACYALENSIEAIEQLRHFYVHQTYSDNPTGKEISAGVRQILVNMLGDNGIEQLLNPTTDFLHIGTARANFSIGASRSFFSKMKFLPPIFANAFGRKYIGNHIERHVFSNTTTQIFDSKDLKSRFSTITEENILDALQASGSIPLVMNPVDFDGAEHWDGGVTDYHWGVDFKVDSGIVLLPHFRDHIMSGWFDKFPPYRKAAGHLVENTVMLYAKKAFIEKLPNQRLTDMEDFYEYADDHEGRFKIWNEACDLGKYLVDDFIKMVETDNLEDIIETF